MEDQRVIADVKRVIIIECMQVFIFNWDNTGIKSPLCGGRGSLEAGRAESVRSFTCINKIPHLCERGDGPSRREGVKMMDGTFPSKLGQVLRSLYHGACHRSVFVQ